jgi:hypothetical protein
MSVRVAVLAALSLVAGTLVALVAGTEPAGAVTPVVSHSHYIRNLTGGSGDIAIMQALGTADGSSGSTGVVLDLGAQSKTAPLSNLHPGVLLTNTNVRLSYLQLVARLKSYLVSYEAAAASHASPPAFVAITTNNDGNYSNYPASTRGTDWWGAIVGPLRQYVSAQHMTHVGVIAGFDVEASFASTLLQAQQWESYYLAKSVGTLANVGSLDGCPTVGTNKACALVHDDTGHNKIWTQANYYGLAHYGSRIKVLPQIYVSTQAAQWTHVDVTGGRGLSYLGSLTENAACGTCSLTPTAGWQALAFQLNKDEGKTPGTTATDLDIQD